MGPTVIIVSTPVVVTIWTTLHVTNRMGNVTEDVNLDIQTVTVAKVINMFHNENVIDIDNKCCFS